MKKIYFTLICFIIANTLRAQVGIGSTSPNSSAKLDIVSTTQGVLFPRMTSTQREAIISPVEGLFVFQINGTKGLYYFDGSYWRNMTTGFIPEGNGLALKQYSIVSTLAGSTQGFADGAGTGAQFNNPNGVAVDRSGNVYVADFNNSSIRKIDPAGTVTTLAGGNYGFADGVGTAAQFKGPSGVAVDGNGNVYVADRFNSKIRKIDAAGKVSTLAGSTVGFADGFGITAQFFYPTSIAVDGEGNVYVADANNNKIRKIDASGNVTTLAGSSYGYLDGAGTAAQFNYPYVVAVDGSGNVYVSDYFNNKIRKINSSGTVTTVAGSIKGFSDGSGSTAEFDSPSGLALDGRGNVYVADSYNHKIRKIDSGGNVTTLAGSTLGFADGSGLAAQFYYPSGVAVDGSGKVYVADQSNNKIRKIVF